MRNLRYVPGMKPLALATVLGAGLLAGTQASAVSLAANTGILNTVSVAFNDAGGVAQTAITASVTVTVNLVPAAPTLNAPANQTIATGGTATYNYTITNNANGIETFAISAADTGLSGSTATPSISTVTLGASTVQSAITIAANGSGTITVPSDLTPDSSINGLKVGNTVVIDNHVFTISSIGSDTAATDLPNATTTITVTNTDGNSTTMAVGDLIEQQVAFTEAVTSGTSANDNSNGTDTVVLTANDSTNSKSATNTTVTTVAGIGLSVNKYVRNVTSGTAGTGTAVVVASNSYYPAGVTGNPGDTLEYLIQVVKGSSASNATSVIVSDPILNFVTYTTSTLKIDNCAGGALTSVTDSANADQGKFASNTVSFFPGTGGSDAGTGGTITAGQTCNMVYRVTIQ